MKNHCGKLIPVAASNKQKTKESLKKLKKLKKVVDKEF